MGTFLICQQKGTRLKFAWWVLFGVLAIAALVPLLGWAWQHHMEARDERRFPPPGVLFDVEGHRMHIFCEGQGTPTVIVEQGIGAQPLSWAPLNEQLSRITTVCAYDRAGMGYSEALDHPTPSTEVAARLHVLLAKAGIGDIVLVGWSAGGMYAREYYRGQTGSQCRAGLTGASVRAPA